MIGIIQINDQQISKTAKPLIKNDPVQPKFSEEAYDHYGKNGNISSYYILNGEKYSPDFPNSMTIAIERLRKSLKSNEKYTKFTELISLNSFDAIYSIVQTDFVDRISFKATVVPEVILEGMNLVFEFMGTHQYSIYLRPYYSLKQYLEYDHQLQAAWIQTFDPKFNKLYDKKEIHDIPKMKQFQSTFSKYGEDKSSLSSKSDKSEISTPSNRYDILANLILLLWNLQPITGFKSELGEIFFHGILGGWGLSTSSKLDNENHDLFSRSIILPNVVPLSSVIYDIIKENSTPLNIHQASLEFWSKNPTIEKILKLLDFGAAYLTPEVSKTCSQMAPDNGTNNNENNNNEDNNNEDNNNEDNNNEDNNSEDNNSEDNNSEDNSEDNN